MTSLPRVIAICGRRRAGKDTIADILIDLYGYQKVRIADPLKKMMQLLFGFTETQLECDVKDVVDPRWDISPRQAMQFFGTDVMQYKMQELLPGIGRKFWIRCMIERELKDPKNDLIVIPDVRFLHEVEELKAYQPWILRVSRPQKAHMVTDDHASETESERIECDAHIKNDGDIAMLRRQLVELLKSRIQETPHTPSEAHEAGESQRPQ